MLAFGKPLAVLHSSPAYLPRQSNSTMLLQSFCLSILQVQDKHSTLLAQVVSDYLTAYDGERAFFEANNRPVTVFTYKMLFRRPQVNYAVQDS